MSQPTPRKVTLADALQQLPGPHSERFALVLKHDDLEIEIYAPRGHDPQQPHTRDEVYIVMAGTGWFVNGPERERFEPGDVLFVPAGVVHRFEEFSDDLVVWVVFYGEEKSGKKGTGTFNAQHPPGHSG